MEVLEGMPHFVDGKVVSRCVPQRAAPGKVYISCPCFVRSGIEVAVCGELPLDANVLAHDFCDVVIGAHEAAVQI